MAELPLTNEELGVLVRLLAAQGLDGGLPLPEAFAERIGTSAAVVELVIARTGILLSEHLTTRQRKSVAASSRDNTAIAAIAAIAAIDTPSPLSPLSDSPPYIPQPQKRPSAREIVESFALTPELSAHFSKAFSAVDLRAALEEWRDHHRANGYRTNQGPVKDAKASFTNWIRRDQKRHDERNRFARPSTRTAPRPQIAADDPLAVRDFDPAIHGRKN